MLHRETIGFEEAKQGVDAVLQEQVKDPQGRGVAVAVVDDHGDLIAFARMSNASSAAGDAAISKAYTSARSRRDTGAYVERMKQQGINIADLANPKLSAFQGGVCIIKPGTDQCVGGIGVSGLPADEDEALAKTGMQSMSLG